MFLLVADERGLSELGGHLMIQKLTRPCAITSIDLNNQSAFKGICKNALVLVDNSRLSSLVSAVITAVEAGYFKRCAVLLLLDSRVAASNEELTRFNIKLRALWSAGIAVIKPWNGFLVRHDEGHFQTSEIANIATRVDQALKRLPKLFSNPATRLVAVHRTGRCIHDAKRQDTEERGAVRVRQGRRRVRHRRRRPQGVGSRQHSHQEGQAPPEGQGDLGQQQPGQWPRQRPR